MAHDGMHYMIGVRDDRIVVVEVLSTDGRPVRIELDVPSAELFAGDILAAAELIKLKGQHNGA